MGNYDLHEACDPELFALGRIENPFPSGGLIGHIAYFRFVRLPRGKDKSDYSLHIVPFSEPDCRILEFIGFESRVGTACPFFDRKDTIVFPQCYAHCVTIIGDLKEKMNEYYHSFGIAYTELVKSERYLSQCGIFLGQQIQVDSDGHNGISNELIGECEDDKFSYKLSLLKKESGKSYIVHCYPKEIPSPELESAFAILGFQKCQECSKCNFERPCYWRSLPDEDMTDNPSAYNRKVEIWFEAHKNHFSLGIEKLVEANTEMGKVGLSFLKP